jgi:hypothetical protein
MHRLISRASASLIAPEIYINDFGGDIRAQRLLVLFFSYRTRVSSGRAGRRD